MKLTIVKPRAAFMALTALPVSTFAASGAPGWLQETMFASGKINSVVIAVAVVLLGIAAWMFALDRRLGKLERQVKGKQAQQQGPLKQDA